MYETIEERAVKRIARIIGVRTSRVKLNKIQEEQGVDVAYFQYFGNNYKVATAGDERITLLL